MNKLKGSEKYYYLKSQGLCVNCGDTAQTGKTRCIRCAQIDAVKQKMREASYSEERKEKIKAYKREYMHNHPEKNREYQRRYRETWQKENKQA